MDTINLIVGEVRRIEERLARVNDPVDLARNGPRFTSFKTGRVDLLRAWHACEKIVQDQRENPELVVGALVTLSAMAMKLAIDTTAAASRGAIEITQLDDFED